MPFDATPDAQVTARDRVIRLRDFLAELPDERFDMGTWGAYDVGTKKLQHDCGTAACIGGWAERLFGRATDEPEAACASLGLDPCQGEALFYPPGHNSGRYTKARAVAVLDHLLATSDPGTVNGVVDWSVAK